VRRITVVGSKKMAVLNDVENEQKIRIYDKGVDTPSYTNSFDEFQWSYRSGDILIPKLRLVEPLRQQCQAFVDKCLIYQRESAYMQSEVLAAGAPDSEFAAQVCPIDPDCTSGGNHPGGPYSCGRDGLRVVKILETAQHSMMNGQVPEVIKW